MQCAAGPEVSGPSLRCPVLQPSLGLVWPLTRLSIDSLENGDSTIQLEKTAPIRIRRDVHGIAVCSDCRRFRARRSVIRRQRKGRTHDGHFDAGFASSFPSFFARVPITALMLVGFCRIHDVGGLIPERISTVAKFHRDAVMSTTSRDPALRVHG